MVRVNAGGDAPPDPPSVGDVMGHSPLLSFLKKNYFENPNQSNGGPSVGDVTGCHYKKK